MRRLDGKVAVVTGGGSGIGRATCKRLSDEGAKLVVVDLRLAGAIETTEQIARSGGEALAVEADVTSLASVESVRQRAIDRFGGIGILVNNAGIVIRKPLESTTEEDWNNILDVNLSGYFRCAKSMVPAMIQAGGGRIINIASVNGHRGWSFPAYSAAKAGVIGLTQELAEELSPYNINVNAVSPGVIVTPLSSQSVDNPDVAKGLLSRIPRGRFGKPEDIAAAIAFLVSDDADFITGVTLPVDGGMINLMGWTGAARSYYATDQST